MYMIKEISFVDTETSTVQYLIFKHSSLTQDAKSRSVNNWLQQLHHGLSLDYGDMEYTEIQKIFQLINYNTIYVKGSQKFQIISVFMPHINVVNMEDQVCPRLNNLL